MPNILLPSYVHTVHLSILEGSFSAELLVHELLLMHPSRPLKKHEALLFATILVWEKEKKYATPKQKGIKNITNNGGKSSDEHL